MAENTPLESKPIHPSIKLDSAQLQRLQDMSDDLLSESDCESKNNRCLFGVHKHMCARILLFITFGASMANLFLLPIDEYRDFKAVASVLDNCVIFMALIGNFGKYRLIYWPFFIVHAIFIGTLAILSTSLLIITVQHVQADHNLVQSRIKDKEERLLLTLGYNLLLFVIHSIVYIQVGHSYRYLGELQREKEAVLMPNLVISPDKSQMLSKF